MQDPGLRYQPSLELLEIGGNQRIRVGGNVISLHVVKPYCGWNEFSKKLKELTTCVFEKVDKVSIERIGFRYINAFNSKLHDIKNVNDLNIKIQSGDKEISELFNLNYLEISDDTHKTLTKVATTNFMSGELPADTSLVVDIDVSSTDKLSLKNIENTVEWLDSAHKYEKVAFFKLFKEDVLKTLVEEW
ncbi:hypothetical protein A3197_01665 [Candidatus Thiodiazotropha endoloripes]|nr:hypothetical protein A3197_01665 [Candidatus Thiodiazotropha endoloripes]